MTLSAHATDDSRPSFLLALLDIERRTLAQVAHGEALKKVLEYVVRSIEAESRDGMRASILLLDSDGRRLRHGAACSLPPAYNQAIDGIEVGPATGSCGAAAFRNESVYVADIAGSPMWAGFRALALEHGLRACWSSPIRAADGRLLGTFANYYGDVREPAPSDIDNIAIAAQTVALVIERHAASRQLREAETRHRQIVNSATQFAIIASDLDGRVTTWNEGARRIFGWSEQDMLGHDTQRIFTPEDRLACLVDIEMKTALAQGCANDERWHLRRSGERFWASGEMMTLKSDDGDIIGFIKILQDRTDAKIAEARLKQWNEVLENEVASRTRERDRLWTVSRDLIATIGRDGRARNVNPAWASELGYQESNLIGAPFDAVIHPDDREKARALFRELTGGAAVGECDLRIRTARDRSAYRWFSWTIGVEDDSLYALGRDITQRMQHVKRMNELNRTLEQRVMARTVERDRLWNTSLDLLAIGSSNGYLLSVNPGYVAALGWSEKESTSRPFIEFVHPDDRARVAECLAFLEAGASVINQEVRRLHKSGGYRWISWTITPEGDRYYMVGRDITDKKESDEAIWRHANFDTLTGLPNRRLFRDRLDQEVSKAERAQRTLALLFIDLDRFKEANDLLGHDVGDLLLIEAGRRIGGCVRKSDTVARLGGDEFTVILSELEHESHVEQTAQKIIDAIAEPFRLGHEIAYLSASVGITLYSADAGSSEELIKNADQAMYAAKSAGRNRFSYFTRSMQTAANNRSRLSGDLRVALQAGQLHVLYQPVIDLRNGRIAKAEALLRWRHPTLGDVEPSRFIPIAEETGLIRKIGDWVFKEVTRCSRRWEQQRGKPFQIAINKSPVQFMSQLHEVNWLTHLAAEGMSGNSIAIEITEGVLLNASNHVTEKLIAYRDAGMQVALDDFGTGYSSMAYLKKFAIDYLKIDQSFVSDMVHDKGDRAIAESIIVMAHKLGLEVIAEGIETREQCDALIEAGCDYGQGFLFSEAVSPEAFECMLLKDAALF